MIVPKVRDDVVPMLVTFGAYCFMAARYEFTPVLWPFTYGEFPKLKTTQFAGSLLP
jgi:hypothetical protein